MSPKLKAFWDDCVAHECEHHIDQLSLNFRPELVNIQNLQWRAQAESLPIGSRKRIIDLIKKHFPA